MNKILAYRAKSRDYFKDDGRKNKKYDEYIEIKPEVFFEDRTGILLRHLQNEGGELVRKETLNASTGMIQTTEERQAILTFNSGLILFSDFSHLSSCDLFYTGIEYLGRIEINLNDGEQEKLEKIIQLCGCIFPLIENTEFLKWLPPDYKG